MDILSILILFALGSWFVYSVAVMIRRRKKGCSGCSGCAGCSSCGLGGGGRIDEKKDKKEGKN